MSFAKAIVLFSLVIAAPSLAWAQEGIPLPGMMPTGVFLPGKASPGGKGFKVGHWVEYSFIRRPQNMSHRFRIAIVGREDSAYWLEMILSQVHRGEAISKILFDPEASDEQDRVRRVIIQPGSHMPLELPVKSGRKMVPQFTESVGTGKLIGTEKIRVRAGVFKAKHYKRTGGSDPCDMWLSENVALWGMVKYRSSKVSMSLAAQGKGAVSRITEQPVKFDPSKIR